MQTFTGTGRLVRLALRRDRIKLPVILLLLSFVFFSSARAALDFYGQTPIDQVKYAAANAPSIISRIFNGPINGADIGAIVLNETYLIVAVVLIFVSTMTVVRHTRQNEEFGRSELIESGVVSRHASLAAAMIVAILLNLVFGCMVFASLILLDLQAGGAVGAAIAMAVTGIAFSAVAAVAAQLADNAKSANGYSALAIGIAFLLRAVGDGTGTVTPDGLAVKSGFLSWLSPIAWGQMAFPFTEKNWWVFGLYAVFFVAVLGIAVVFLAKRDIGMGMIATRPGRARALKQLLSPFGLARRLQRGTLRGWAIAITVLGVSFGFVIKEFEDFIKDNEQFREVFAQSGVTGSIREIFLSVLISMMSIMIAGYAIHSSLQLRSEESDGQLESILGTSVSRWQWQLSHISFASLGVILLATLSGLSIGIPYVVSTGSSWSQLWPILGAALTYSTAVFTLLGFVIVVIAFLPRMAVALAWASFVGCLLIVQLGVVLKLPGWVVNLSPFGHLPPMPAQDFELTPVIGLLSVAMLFLVVSLAYFNRRDITTA